MVRFFCYGSSSIRPMHEMLEDSAFTTLALLTIVGCVSSCSSPDCATGELRIGNLEWIAAMLGMEWPR